MCLAAAAEVVTLVACIHLNVSAWRAIPVCLFSFLLGSVVSGLSLLENRAASLASFCLLLVMGILPTPLPTEVRYQAASAGLFGLVELRERAVAAEQDVVSPRAERARRVLARLSGLTLYFFMFQHVVVDQMVSGLARSLDPSFGTFDYWGVAAMVVLVTALISRMMTGLEDGVKALFA